MRGGRAGAVLAWSTFAVLIGLWLLTATGRAWRAPPAVFVVAVLLLPYLYGALAAWSFGAWTLLPDRRLVPGVLVALFVSGLALWGPPFAGAADPSVGEPLRVMTWNVRRLWGPADALGRPDERRRAVRCVVEGVGLRDPDVVALLEVSAMDVADLSARLDLSCVHGDYMGVDQEDLGGIAVCARSGRWSIRSGGPRKFVDDEDWFYAFAEVERDGAVVNVIAAHLQPYALGASRIRRRLDNGGVPALIALSRHGERVSRSQGDQAAALLDRVERHRDPTVVLGDFNSTRDSALHTSLRRVMSDVWEAGGQGFGPTVQFLGLLPMRVDYIYASPALGVVGAEVPPLDCSDHRPVIADLRIGSRAR